LGHFNSFSIQRTSIRSYAYEIYRRVYCTTNPVVQESSTLKKDKLQSFLEKLHVSDPVAVNNELERYLGLPRVQNDTNPLDWWKVNNGQFPILSKMAQDYLAVPASSVPCEEVFSSGVDLVTANRNRLEPDTIEMSTCLKY
jgi:hypothetical protein